MDAYVSTFKRIEKKYHLSAQQMEKLSIALAPYIEVDEYGVARIDSLYYDTPDRALIARSLEKPLYKEKLRVRAYGDMAAATCVFVEMKKKYDGVVYKRRVKVSRQAAAAWLSGACGYEEAVRAYPLHAAMWGGDGAAFDGENGVPAGEGPAGEMPCAKPVCAAALEASEPEELSWANGQIAREIDAMVARCGGVEPSMLISCNRAAYRTRHGVASGVRITFDNAIVYRDLRAGAGACGQGASRPMTPLLRPGEMLMEVKCAGAMPLWLARALADAHAYPSSFSKYGNAYQHVMAATDANGAGRAAAKHAMGRNGAGCAAARRDSSFGLAAGVADARDPHGGGSAGALRSQLPQQLQQTQKPKGVRCA